MHSYRQGSKPLTGRIMVTLGASSTVEDTGGGFRSSNLTNLAAEAQEISPKPSRGSWGKGWEEGLHGSDADSLDYHNNHGPDKADAGYNLNKASHFHA